MEVDGSGSMAVNLDMDEVVREINVGVLDQ